MGIIWALIFLLVICPFEVLVHGATSYLSGNWAHLATKIAAGTFFSYAAVVSGDSFLRMYFLPHAPAIASRSQILLITCATTTLTATIAAAITMGQDLKVHQIELLRIVGFVFAIFCVAVSMATFFLAQSTKTALDQLLR